MFDLLTIIFNTKRCHRDNPTIARELGLEIQ